MLFVSCVGLYIVYFPYWVNYQYYLTGNGNVRDFESLIRNTIPMPFWESNALLFDNPLVPYAWYALGGLLLVLILGWMMREKPQPLPPAKDKAIAP